ncbi:hypothetical protein COCVIDRAFT_103538 [Bipolaris victoriae FI3]|uniref:Uncharacterized protein n=1 Tax=Bipolaris victoriae (strain FI3) TaxID=930091 RepID=W7EEL9_BIPV3|nr:hypothetical protein COCVIDRAFT_103538 [Bipolaris victoriae FI3]
MLSRIPKSTTTSAASSLHRAIHHLPLQTSLPGLLDPFPPPPTSSIFSTLGVIRLPPLPSSSPPTSQTPSSSIPHIYPLSPHPYPPSHSLSSKKKKDNKKERKKKCAQP